MASYPYMAITIKVYSIGTRKPMIFHLGLHHRGLKVFKVSINDVPGLILTYFITRSNMVKICYCAEYQAQMSCERLQDHWSSGL